QRAAPLAGAGFGGQSLGALRLVVEGLRDRRVRFVGAGRAAPLILVVDPCGRLELPLQPGRPHQRGRPPEPECLLNRLRDVDIAFLGHLLLDQLHREERRQVLRTNGLLGGGMQRRAPGKRKIGLDVVPALGQLSLVELDPIGDFRRVNAHRFSLLWSLGFSMDESLVQTPDRTGMIAALERLVLAESPSTDKARCDACADEVAELFRQRLGVSAIRHRRPNAGDHLEIRLGDGTDPIVVLCHHDTVWPDGTLGRLPYRVDGDRVTGPGSYDMKAGIVEAAFALEQARPRRPVVVLSTSDEEIGSASSRGLIEETARGALAVLVLEPA